MGQQQIIRRLTHGRFRKDNSDMSKNTIYNKLAERLGLTESKLLPRIFKELATPFEARLLLALPATPGELAIKFSLNGEKTKEILDILMVKGLAIPLVKEGVSRYFIVRNALQLHDSSLQFDSGEKVSELWHRFRESEWYDICKEWGELPMPGMRVLPFPNAVQEQADLVFAEDMEAVAQKAAIIAVVRCVCRTVMKGCGHPLDVCFVFDAGAEFALRRGTGRKIGIDEAHSIFDRSAQEGLVPQAMNRAKVAHLCFCCADCCIFFEPYAKFGYRLIAPSRYQAVVDEGLCNGCQECVERCQFDAIDMRQTASSRILKAFVAPEKCYGCGVCAIKCSPVAMRLKVVRPALHIPQTNSLY